MEYAGELYLLATKKMHYARAGSLLNFVVHGTHSCAIAIPWSVAVFYINYSNYEAIIWISGVDTLRSTFITSEGVLAVVIVLPLLLCNEATLVPWSCTCDLGSKIGMVKLAT